MNERFELQGKDLVLDRETGLIWQRGSSAERMVWNEGFAYIEELNQKKYAGFSDWRYPTKDELGSLILPEEDRLSGLYISPLFDKQRNFWSVTEAGHHRACYADFYYGDMYIIEDNYATYVVRAVRTL